jgi:hypothetical protein
VDADDHEPLLELLLLERRLATLVWIVACRHVVRRYPCYRLGKRIDYAGLR